MAMTVSLLTEIGDTSNTNSYATSSVSPAAAALILVGITCSTGGTLGDPSSVTGNGITYTKVGHVDFNSIAAPNRRTLIYRGLSSAPTSGAITSAWPSNQSGVGTQVVQVVNADTSGTNGAGACVNFDIVQQDSGSTIVLTMDALSNSANLVVAFFGGVQQNNHTPTTDWTGLGSGATWATPTMGQGVMYKGNDTTADASGGGIRGGIGVEIREHWLPRPQPYYIPPRTAVGRASSW